ncbi:hypothetical protein D9758_004204 [Tetrapyrgos nigripes]|uniref:Uncharacterized protein n=1 Tax=Tetrapyrgos nigripes TaxID=182062 RepID=A0A8H5LVA7_9AGAR|nr:hypothetical protein D9758_004204 [Tetrapyrgos nigripes]
MPPKPAPKIYQILLRTHKLTIFFTLSPSATVASLKEEALGALTSDVNQVEDVPQVHAVDKFEICRRDKAGRYELLDEGKELKESKISNWEVLYIQFKDESGNLAPITVTEPSIDDDEDVQSMAPPPSDLGESDVRKGKRKAMDE